MKKLISSTTMIVLAAVLFIAASNAQAFVSWTSASGSADSFDWSGGGSETGLFGDPNVIGDTLEFSPDDFIALSEGQGLVEVWDTLVVTITAKPGQKLTSIQIDESGDYEILGTGSVDMFTSISIVGADANNPYYEELLSDPLMPIEAIYSNPKGDWSAATEIILNDEDSITITLFNMLQADTDDYSNALIQKKHLGDSVAIRVVPEPATLAILTLGAVSLFRRRRA